MLVNDADAVALKHRDHRLNIVDFVRQVMQALAPPPKEIRYEALVAGQLLDKFERLAADVKVLPRKSATRLLAQFLVVARMGREMASKEGDPLIESSAPRSTHGRNASALLQLAPSLAHRSRQA